MKILVVGDILVDTYIYVSSRRMAEEAYIPIWEEDFSRREHRPGGAANVANNLKAIGGEEVDVHIMGICGDLRTMRQLGAAGIQPVIWGADEASTMVKKRFVDTKTMKYVMRLDHMTKFPQDDVDYFESYVDQYIEHCADHYDAIIFSDYDKGTITPKIVDRLKTISSVFVVDSKREDLRIFQGSSILKVNEKEYSAQVSSKLYPNVAGLFDFVVVTLGKEGAELMQCDKSKSDDSSYVVHSETFKAKTVKSVDVTGCGDTHTAALTFALLKKGDIRSAVSFANECAANVVQRFGTSIVV